MAHRGVEASDPRNIGVLALLAPADLSDAAVVRERLTRMLRGASAAKIEETVPKVLGAKGAPPPVSQSVLSVADPYFGLNTHRISSAGCGRSMTPCRSDAGGSSTAIPAWCTRAPA